MNNNEKVLNFIRDRKKVKIGAISEDLKIRNSSVSRILKKLESENKIKRVTTPNQLENQKGKGYESFAIYLEKTSHEPIRNQNEMYNNDQISPEKINNVLTIANIFLFVFFMISFALLTSVLNTIIPLGSVNNGVPQVNTDAQIMHIIFVLALFGIFLIPVLIIVELQINISKNIKPKISKMELIRDKLGNKIIPHDIAYLFYLIIGFSAFLIFAGVPIDLFLGLNFFLTKSQNGNSFTYSTNLTNVITFSVALALVVWFIFKIILYFRNESGFKSIN